MAEVQMSEEDRREANRLWDDYQAKHDLADQMGRVAGIEPKTGKIWFGEWITDVVAARDAEGIDSPLVFVRVGRPYVVRKGGRR